MSTVRTRILNAPISASHTESVCVTIDPASTRDHQFAVRTAGGEVFDLSQRNRGVSNDPTRFVTGSPGRGFGGAEKSRQRKISEALFGLPGAGKAMRALCESGISV